MSHRKIKNIFVAGHLGMVGSSLCSLLSKNPSNNILTITRAELDLTSQSMVSSFFKKNEIDEVYLAAAKVGGIYANETYPADFIYSNLIIQNNIIFSCYENKVNKMLFLGSSCIYPKETSQPIKEHQLMTGHLEPTNEPYAIAKIAGIKMCESFNRQYGTDFRSVMPTNLYGPNDNFNPENSHVLPALIRKFVSATENEDLNVEIWGSGKPKREFLHVDDFALAAVHLMQINKKEYDSQVPTTCSHINIGSGSDISIEELSNLIGKLCNYKGEIIFNKTKPDGMMKKLLDISLISNLGWSPSISLEQGILQTIKWYKANKDTLRS